MATRLNAYAGGNGNAVDKRSRIRGVGANNGASSSKTNSIYRPFFAQDLRCVSFKWVRGGSAYTIRGSNLQHKGEGGSGVPGAYHGPVIGDLLLSPQTGKFYYDIRINCDNFRVGVCSENAFTIEDSLETAELGKVMEEPASSNHSKGVREGDCKEGNYAMVERPENLDGEVQSVVAVFHGQTSKVVVNGLERKQLWRTIIPASGALLSFVVDTDEGVVQLFVDKKYAGLVFDPKCNLKGKSLVPCCSLGGLDESNRSLAKGCFHAIVSPPHKFDCVY